MRELQAGHDVADRVDAGDVGGEALAGQHEAAIHLDARLFEAEALGRGTAAYRNEQVVGREHGAVLEIDGATQCVLRDRLEAHADFEIDLPPAEGALELLRDRLLLVRQEVGQTFDDGDLGAERAPYARELDTDHAAAQDEDLRRHLLQLQRLLAGDHPAADLEARQRAGVRTGGEHHVLADDVVGAHLNGGRQDQSALALDHGDAVRLEQAPQALELAGDEILSEPVDAGHVDARHARLDAVGGDVCDLSGVEQGLGRHAAAVQAGAAQFVLLDHSGAEPQLGRTDCGRISGAAAAQNDDVKLLIGQVGSPLDLVSAPRERIR